MLAFCLAEVRGSQKWGVGVVKNLEPGVILAERKGCLFSPVRGKIWWLFGENTLQQRKRHSMLKSDASFCLSRKVSQTKFPKGCICLRRSGWVKIAISGRCSNRMPPGITNPNVKKHVVSLGGTYFRFRVRFKLVTI